jgi:hypothetical protein
MFLAPASYRLMATAALLAACTSFNPVPDDPRPSRAPDENAEKKEEAPSTGRSRFDLPGECSAKLAVSHGISDMAECEGLLGETRAVPISVKAIAADPDAVDARIAVGEGAGVLADATLHATFTDGRPTADGDLTFGRFSGEFLLGPQVYGFVLRERSGIDSVWVFHITGGSGCLSNARGELSLADRTRGTLKLEKSSMTACLAPSTPATAVDPPAAPDAGAH